MIPVVIGDSLAEGTKLFLSYPTYAAVGRTLEQGEQVIRGLSHKRVMIVGLGTNNYPSANPKPVIRLVRSRSDCSVWISVHRSGYDFSRFNAKLPAHRVKWARRVRKQPWLLGPDHTHATLYGYSVRAKMVRRAVKRYC